MPARQLGAWIRAPLNPAVEIAASQNPETRIALFQRKEFRRTIHNHEGWFVVEDVGPALIESGEYWQYARGRAYSTRARQNMGFAARGTSIAWIALVMVKVVEVVQFARPIVGLCSRVARRPGSAVISIVRVWSPR